MACVPGFEAGAAFCVVSLAEPFVAGLVCGSAVAVPGTYVYTYLLRALVQ